MNLLLSQRWISPPKLGLFILVTVWKLCLSNDVEFGDECKYHGDMCDVDPEKCIRRMKAEGRLIMECYPFLHYGPGTLYETREDTEFWMAGMLGEWVHGWTQSDSANLTYTIYRKTVDRLNWDEPNSLSPLPGCCSMTLNDTCTLPKRGPNDTHYFVMPVKNERRNWYCIFEIEERSGYPSYCEDGERSGCVEFVNGSVQMKDLYIPLSTHIYRPKVDFCFFTPPDELVHVPNETDWRYPVPTKGINVAGEGDNIFASTEGRNLSCSLVKDTRGENIPSLSEKYHVNRMGDFVCYFLRFPQSSGHWLDARCDKAERKPVFDNSGVVIPLVIAICVCTVVLVSIIVIVWLYKKHFINFTFEKTMEELPKTLAKDNLEDYRFIGDEPSEKEIIHSAKERPKEIPSFHISVSREDKMKLASDSVDDHRFQNGGFVRYTEVVAVNDINEMSTPTSPGCTDSGITFELAEKDTEEYKTKHNISGSKEEDSGFSFTSFKDREDSGIPSPDVEVHDGQDASEKTNLRSGAYTEKKEIAYRTVGESSNGELIEEIPGKNKHGFPLYVKKSAIDCHDADIVIDSKGTEYFPKIQV